MIGREDKKMLNSILERPWNKIVIEKILSTTDSTMGKKELIYEPEEVKKEVDRYFANQFKEDTRPPREEVEVWKEEYTPCNYIQHHWYNNILDEITAKE